MQNGKNIVPAEMANRMRGFGVWLLAALMLLVPSTSLAGRGDKAGTAAATELLVPIGAASIGMGNSAIATAVGIEAIYWNPAGLSRTTYGSMGMISHMTYLADISVEYGAVSTGFFGLGSVALSLKTFSIGDIPVTTEEYPDGTGETISPTMMVVGGTFARNISDRISMGLNAKIIYEKMGDVSANDICFDAGVQYSGLGGVPGLEFGVVLKNIGPKMRYEGTGLLRNATIEDGLLVNTPVKLQASSDDLPSTIEIGLAYTSVLDEANAVRMASVFRNNNYSEDEYGLGAEYGYDHRFFARLGYDFASGLEGREYIFGPTFGFGVKTTVYDLAVSVDYAYRSVEYFSGNHVITLSVGY